MSKVTFQSEGERVVGNLFLPADHRQGDRLPVDLQKEERGLTEIEDGKIVFAHFV